MNRIVKNVLIVAISFFFVSCATSSKTIVYNEGTFNNSDLSIHEGLLSRESCKIKYRINDKTMASIKISDPIVVAQAEQEEDWGYFQFPVIGKSKDGTLRVSWQMKADSHQSYGKKNERGYSPKVSRDGGRTWEVEEDNSYFITRGYNMQYEDGSVLQIGTPAAKNIKLYKTLPKPIIQRGKYAFYKEEQLPDDLRGFYLYHENTGSKSQMIHAFVKDPGLLRYAYVADDLMPVVLWGNIKQLSDKSIIAGLCPTFYLDDKTDDVTEGSVTFYQSWNNGETWELLSRIPFARDGIANVRGNNSFEEPAFEILADSSFLCVMRSGASSPLYRIFSYDKGKTWTNPEPFTPNGVKPKLLMLRNGVLVLTSGRPGVQLRFSIDGSGYNWTTPIDMVSYMNEDGSYTRDVSCGYTSIIEDGDNSFYMVYSDFTTKNSKGDMRKSIVFRKVEINIDKNNVSRTQYRNKRNK